jgi:hypothetical protein
VFTDSGSPQSSTLQHYGQLPGRMIRHKPAR